MGSARFSHILGSSSLGVYEFELRIYGSFSQIHDFILPYALNLEQISDKLL